MKDYMLDPPDDELEAGEEFERDWEAEAELKREMDIEDFNRPGSDGWAPADFVYDPLSKRGFE
jgi:hypothetical protein